MKQILFWKPESVSSPKVPQLHGGAFWTKASVGPPWLPMGGWGAFHAWKLVSKKKGWVFLKEKFYKRKIYSVKSSNFEEIVEKTRALDEANVVNTAGEQINRTHF